MAQENQAVAVEIYDQTYQLTSTDGADVKYIRRAAALLDKKMREAAAAVGTRSPLDIAILAAMDIAQQIVEEKQKKTTLIDKTDERINDFTQRIENRNATPPIVIEGDDPVDPPSSDRF